MILDRIQTFIGEIARPYAIIVTATGAAIASVIVALRVENGNDGSIMLGAIFAGIVGFYGAKAWEIVRRAGGPQSEAPPPTGPDHQS